MQSSHASSSSPAQADRRVAVLLPLPLAGSYDYGVPDGLELSPGDFVRVPLGKREEIGVVWGTASGEVTKVRPVTARLDLPPLPEESRKLVDWVAAYTLSPPGAVLKMAMSVPAVFDPVRPHIGYAAASTVPAGLKMTEARRKVLELATGAPLSATDLAEAAGVGASVVRGLADAGALIGTPISPVTFERPDIDRAGPTLSGTQAAAATALADAVGQGFSVTLLEGVTGSGKTEVYYEAVAEALRQGRQVLVLLPEIALSAQWFERFQRRFGAAPAIWHSELGVAHRRETWKGVADGRVPLVVGARSALFLPYRDLGLIVVDEEHDAAFKQEEQVLYNARDMAVVRGRIGDHPVVLASATPSLETITNVQGGRYRRLHLPDRHAGAELPEVVLIDLRREPPERGKWISPRLAQAVAETLAAGEQVMLFLNRRGYAPLTLCRTCGHRLQCPHCSAWLVDHRRHQRLQCHHCGHMIRLPEKCPSCEAEDSFAACGPGVERLHEEVLERFPQARSEIMASDTLSGPAAAAALVERMARREIDLLIGTQIVAKGHHFPLLTLVGVVDADLGLAGGDLRAAERTYQLLSQVAGRAGRAEHPGRVMLQTYQPEHPVMQALARSDQDSFLAEEAEQRRMVGMPPFGKLVALIVSAADPAVADRVAAQLARTAPRDDGVQVLGPAPAPLSLLRGRHRRRLLMKAERRLNVQALLRRWLSQVEVPAGARVQVDVDPYSFF